MEQNNFEKGQRRNLLIVGIICLVGIIGIVGYTYSFFQVEDKDTGTITGTVASASLSVEVEKLAPDVDKALVPQLDTAIAAAVVGTQGNCIDDNHNAVCQVYSITVQNTSSVAINIDGLLELNAGNNPNLKWTLIDSYQDNMTTRPNVTSSINPHQITTLTANETYTANQIKTYYLVVWISETNYVQADTGEFTGTVTFNDAEVQSPASNTLYNVLNIVPKKDVLTTFTTTSKLDGTTGVYKAEDDIGTSYYFRGNVVNNYVKFGKYTEDAYALVDEDTLTASYSSTPCDTSQQYICTKIASANDDMYWRIVRVNGDGTIRLVYAGTQPYANDDGEELRNIGYSAYNANYDDNAYVGYMYGTVPSTSYNNAHTNDHDSSIKTTIDRWYTKYINTNYGGKVADAIYCNDRSVPDETTTGFGTAETYYGFFNRANEETMAFYPTLTCERELDRFTRDDSVSGVVGNSELTYPVAMLTVDELVYAGGHFFMNESFVNEKSYMFDTNWFWSLSPDYFLGGNANAWGGVGGAFFYVRADYNYGVRVSLSLSSTAITGGTGTAIDPFTVS